MKKYLNLIFLSFVLMIFGCTQTPQKNEAFIMSKQLVEASMKRTDLKFTFADFRADDIKNGGFIVESKFAAINAQGINQEVNYRVKMKWNGGDWSKVGNWTLEDIKVW